MGFKFLVLMLRWVDFPSDKFFPSLAYAVACTILMQALRDRLSSLGFNRDVSYFISDEEIPNESSFFLQLIANRKQYLIVLINRFKVETLSIKGSSWVMMSAVDVLWSEILTCLILISWDGNFDYCWHNLPPEFIAFESISFYATRH